MLIKRGIIAILLCFFTSQMMGENNVKEPDGTTDIFPLGWYSAVGGGTTLPAKATEFSEDGFSNTMICYKRDGNLGYGWYCDKVENENTSTFKKWLIFQPGIGAPSIDFHTDAVSGKDNVLGWYSWDEAGLSIELYPNSTPHYPMELKLRYDTINMYDNDRMVFMADPHPETWIKDYSDVDPDDNVGIRYHETTDVIILDAYPIYGSKLRNVFTQTEQNKTNLQNFFPPKFPTGEERTISIDGIDIPYTFSDIRKIPRYIDEMKSYVSNKPIIMALEVEEDLNVIYEVETNANNKPVDSAGNVIFDLNDYNSAPNKSEYLRYLPKAIPTDSDLTNDYEGKTVFLARDVDDQEYAEHFNELFSANRVHRP